jgi:hypothetical protein
MSTKKFEITTLKGSATVLATRSEDFENQYKGQSKVWFEYSAFPVCFQPDSNDEDQDIRQAPLLESRIIEGVASSLSKDSHGTEMSIGALAGMARQMKKGVPYLPSHDRREWDDVMGKTFDAEVREGLLRASVQLYDIDMSEKLIDRVGRGQTIGWSIGGWFTDLTFVTNDDDEVERVIVEGVELDHLATTRRPSNPDTWISQIRCVEDEVEVRGLTGEDTESGSGLVQDKVNVEELESSEETEDRKVIPYRNLPLAPEEMKWEWNATTQNAILGRNEDWKRYQKAHAWFDPENRETKAGYKLPFAAIVDGQLKVVWRGVAAAMGALLGARGGVDIPADQKEGVYNLLVRYYKRFDKPAPEFKEMSSEEFDSLSERHIIKVTEDENTVVIAYAKMHDNPETDEDYESGYGKDDKNKKYKEDDTEMVDKTEERDTITVDSADANQGAESLEEQTQEDSIMDEKFASEIRSGLEGITTLIGQLAERVTAVEVRAEETPVAVEKVVDNSEELDAMRSELEKFQSMNSQLKNTLDKMAKQPLRRSLVHMNPVKTASTFERKIDESLPSHSALAASMKQNIAVINDKKSNRSELQDALRAVLNAAEADGYIG